MNKRQTLKSGDCIPLIDILYTSKDITLYKISLYLYLYIYIYYNTIIYYKWETIKKDELRVRGYILNTS